MKTILAALLFSGLVCADPIWNVAAAGFITAGPQATGVACLIIPGNDSVTGAPSIGILCAANSSPASRFDVIQLDGSGPIYAMPLFSNGAYSVLVRVTKNYNNIPDGWSAIGDGPVVVGSIPAPTP